MSGATRKGLPRCEEMVVKYRERSPIGVEECGKPAVSMYFYRAVSDIPRYCCEYHDKEMEKHELRDDLERDEEDAWEEYTRRQNNV
jgi:hypothetical protein